MEWLEQHRRERRWWASSATLAALSLVLGVLAVVPALADSTDASCVVEEGDELSASWSGVPDGLELTLLAETGDGELHTVATGKADNVVGYGTVGAWRGVSYPGAVSYSLSGDPTAGGGSVGCEPTRLPDDDGSSDEITGDGGEAGSGGAPRFFAEATLDCSSQAVSVAVTNSGIVDGIVVAEIGTESRELTVTAGATEVVSAPFSGDEPLVVVVERGDDLVLETSVPTTCDAAAPELESVIDVICQGGAAVVGVTVTNAGAARGSAAVTIAGTTSVTVAPGATETLIETVDGQGPLAVLVADQNGTVIAAYQAIDVCASPAPDLLAKSSLFCGSLEIEILAVNSGTAVGVVSVAVGEESIALSVPAGGHRVHVVPITAGETVRVVAHDGSTSLLDVAYEGVCKAPKPSLRLGHSLDCAAANVTVTVTNDGDLEGEATILLDGREVARVVVAPGASVDQVVEIDAAAGHSLLVLARNEDAALLVTDIDPCATPGPALSASADLDCEAGTVTVAVVNDGDAPGSAEVTINDTTETVVVPAGAVVERTSGLDIGGATVARVVVGGVTLMEETTDDTCVIPGAALVASTVLDCANGQIVIRLENGGQIAGDAVVTINGENQAVTVAPGETLRVLATLTLEGAYAIEVAVDGESILSQSGTGACAVPEGNVLGSVDVSCTGGGATVIVSNGRSDDNYAVEVVNGEEQTFVVPAGSVVERTISLDEDEAYVISVSAGDAVLGSASGTFDCENAEVKAKTKKKKPDKLTELPRTGAANTAMLTTAALSLVLTGLLALRASAIRRERFAEIRSS